MPVIDTSWLVALHAVDDAHHAKAMREAATHGALFVPLPILEEFLAVITQRIARKESPSAARLAARKALQGLRQQPNIRFSIEANLDHIQEVYLRNPSLSFADAVAASAAILHRMPLLSFEEDQLAVVGSSKS